MPAAWQLLPSRDTPGGSALPPAGRSCSTLRGNAVSASPPLAEFAFTVGTSTSMQRHLKRWNCADHHAAIGFARLQITPFVSVTETLAFPASAMLANAPDDHHFEIAVDQFRRNSSSKIAADSAPAPGAAVISMWIQQITGVELVPTRQLACCGYCTDLQISNRRAWSSIDEPASGQQQLICGTMIIFAEGSICVDRQRNRCFSKGVFSPFRHCQKHCACSSIKIHYINLRPLSSISGGIILRGRPDRVYISTPIDFLWRMLISNDRAHAWLQNCNLGVIALRAIRSGGCDQPRIPADGILREPSDISAARPLHARRYAFTSDIHLALSCGGGVAGLPNIA